MLLPIRQRVLELLHRSAGNSIQIFMRRKKVIYSICLRKSPNRFYHSSQSGLYILSKQSKMYSEYTDNRIYNSCLCGRRYLSDMKNDELVKAWLSEIKDDFQKEKKSQQNEIAQDGSDKTEKLQDKLTSNEKNDTNLETSENNKDNDNKDNMEEMTDIHGFTVDEMIELVKQAQSSETMNNKDVTEGSDESDLESSSSDSEGSSDTSSSSESDDDSLKDEKDTSEEKVKPNPNDDKMKTQSYLDDRDIGLKESDMRFASSKIKYELEKALTKTKSRRPLEKLKNMSDNITREQDDSIEASHKIREEVEISVNTEDNTKDEIEDFVNVNFQEPEEEVREWKPPVALTRGLTGVFDIEELVKVLEASRARDTVVIKIPDQVEFANYMVIVSSLTYRHMKAILSDVKWIYKRKKLRTDNTIKIEGEESKDWFALDLGNIILHIFTPATREHYDLETLWTVGPSFDPKCQQDIIKPQVFSLSDLPWLEELEKSESIPKKH